MYIPVVKDIRLIGTFVEVVNANESIQVGKICVLVGTQLAPP
jgi:hypothetical protein